LSKNFEPTKPHRKYADKYACEIKDVNEYKEFVKPYIKQSFEHIQSVVQSKGSKKDKI
jgi:hypothetical protein